MPSDGRWILIGRLKCEEAL